MLPETAFSLAHASPNQMIAFFCGAIAHILFFAWIVYLVRMR
jgi:hypothetical protein